MGLFRRKKRPDDVQPSAAIVPQPVAVNPADSERIGRIHARIARCQQAMDASSNDLYRERMRRAIRKHKAALIAAGIDDGAEL